MTLSDNFCFLSTEFESKMHKAWKQFQKSEDFCDVVLKCEDKHIPAHRIIISSYSPVLKDLMKRNTRLVVDLTGIKYDALKYLLDCMYEGEVNVSEKDVESFLDLAKNLQVEGLVKRNEIFKISKETPSLQKLCADDTKTEHVEKIICPRPEFQTINENAKKISPIKFGKLKEFKLDIHTSPRKKFRQEFIIFDVDGCKNSSTESNELLMTTESNEQITTAEINELLMTTEINEEITTAEINEQIKIMEINAAEINEIITTAEINEEITTAEINEEITTAESNEQITTTESNEEITTTVKYNKSNEVVSLQQFNKGVDNLAFELEEGMDKITSLNVETITNSSDEKRDKVASDKDRNVEKIVHDNIQRIVKKLVGIPESLQNNLSISCELCKKEYLLSAALDSHKALVHEVA